MWSGSAFHCPYYIKKLSHEKHVEFYEIKNFSIGPNLENLDEFLNLLREYKNICGKVRSIKFSIKSKQFHQSIESVFNDFRNKNVKSAWLKIKKLYHPMYSNSTSSSVLKDKQGNILFSHSDLSDCNNYRGISLINDGLKIISKIVTNTPSRGVLDLCI